MLYAIEAAAEQGMEVVIPPKRNRKIQCIYDKDLDKIQHMVDNFFLRMKEWRRITARFANNTQSSLATIDDRP